METPITTKYPPYRQVLENGDFIINHHRGQESALKSKVRFVAIQAGTQGGKTCFEPEWLYRELGIRGEGDYLVGTATFPLLERKLLPERSTYEHVQQFKKITEGLQVVRCVGGNATTEDEIRQGCAAHGWKIDQPKISGVTAQIHRVYAMHKLNKIHPFSDLYNYLDEKTTFFYQLDDDFKPLDKFEDEPRFHLLAAERYILSDFEQETAKPDRGWILHGW